VLQRLRNRWGQASARLIRRMGPRSYLWLAALFSVFILVDSSALHLISTMENRVFDLLIRYRLRAPAPDPDIVIVDIDERSLAAMAKEYGRWPWPNQVLGEFVAGVEKQAPKAIVFDILFSDPDVARPQSDAYFNEVIAASRHSFFPMLRLNPENDALSQIRPSLLPGVTPLPGRTSEDRTLAIILPQVPAALANGRLGTHNVEPDKDSVIRRYPFYLEHAGWRIPSLPTRIAESLDKPLPAQREFLINWRGKPFTYRYLSFADVYRDFLRKHGERPADEFAGKIVVIGSTAPSLFDIKASPTAKIFPGVEILATAIDNAKNGDWLRWQPTWLTLSMSLAFVWGMAIALTRLARIEVFDTAFTVLQVSFVATSYATLNWSTYYLDMSAPITLGLIYFSAARIYANLSQYRLANTMRYSFHGRASGVCRMDTLTIRLNRPHRGERRRLKSAINQLVASSPLQASRIHNLIGDPGLVRSIFEDLILVYWLVDQGDDSGDDIRRIEAGVRQTLPRALAEGRLVMGSDGGEMRWDSPDGWQKDAYRIILAALAHGEPVAAQSRYVP